MIELRILRGEDYPDGPYMQVSLQRGDVTKRGEGNVMTEARNWSD